MSSESAKNIVVFVTCPVDGAGDLATALVKSRLAACVNIIGEVRSIYSWKGEVCDDPEAMMVIKTRGDRFEALRQKVVELHPYDVPEVVALPIVAGHAPYLQWLEQNVG